MILKVILLSLLGNHNYHHDFPYDYFSSPSKVFWESFNPSSLMIELSAFLGQVYDLKRASPAVVEGTIKRVGVPAYFDAPKGVAFRVASGLFDWTLGLALHLWPVAVCLAWERFTGTTVFVYGIQ